MSWGTAFAMVSFVVDYQILQKSSDSFLRIAVPVSAISTFQIVDIRKEDQGHGGQLLHCCIRRQVSNLQKLSHASALSLTASNECFKLWTF